jgi:hypothetical protein
METLKTIGSNYLLLQTHLQYNIIICTQIPVGMLQTKLHLKSTFHRMEIITQKCANCV